MPFGLNAKRQLAAEVLNAMAMAAQTWSPGEEPRVRFAYACALDESGCVGALAHLDWAGLRSMKECSARLWTTQLRATRSARSTSVYAIRRSSTSIGLRRDYSACRIPRMALSITGRWRVQVIASEEAS